MAGSGKAHIFHVTAGTPIVGLWCDTCLLPSRYEVPVHAMSEDGPWQIGLVNHCNECTGGTE